MSDVTEATAKLKLTLRLSESLEQDGVKGSVVKEVVGQLERALKAVPQASKKGEGDKDKMGKPPALIQEKSSGVAPNTASSEEAGITTRVEQPVDDVLSNHHTHMERSVQVTRVPTTLIPTPPSSPFQMLSLLVPPIETLPYLSPQPGAKSTFASKLYWSTMALSYRLASGSEQLHTAPRLLLYHMRFHSLESVAARIARRILIESTGVIHQDAEPRFTWQLTHHIIQDLALEGEDVKRYLDAREVELWFWRRGVDANVLGDGELVAELARCSVCFGDGPRFLVDDVERVFGDSVGGMVAGYPGLAF